MGTKEVRELIQQAEDGGASFIFERTKEDPRASVPTDRIGQYQYIINQSAPLAYLITEVLDGINAPRDPSM